MIKVLRRLLTFLFFTAVAVIVVLVSVANREPMALSFFPLPYEMLAPKFLLILAIFVLGLVSGILSVSGTLLRLRSHKKQKDRKIHALENQIESMKLDRESLPLPATLAE